MEQSCPENNEKYQRMKMPNRKLLSIIFVAFLLGCQPQDTKISEEEPSIEISGGEPIIKEIEEEFDDNLDAALEELGEIENI